MEASFRADVKSCVKAAGFEKDTDTQFVQISSFLLIPTPITWQSLWVAHAISV